DYGSSTHSVACSIYGYEVSITRMKIYHSGKYMMLNNEAELDRVDIAYHAIRLSTGKKHYHTSVPNPT
ncbi:uncharacterized protein A1O9_06956, partial [Exophiala aquamarina CBS 119918]